VYCRLMRVAMSSPIELEAKTYPCAVAQTAKQNVICLQLAGSSVRCTARYICNEIVSPRCQVRSGVPGSVPYPRYVVKVFPLHLHSVNVSMDVAGVVFNTVAAEMQSLQANIPVTLHGSPGMRLALSLSVVANASSSATTLYSYIGHHPLWPNWTLPPRACPATTGTEQEPLAHHQSPGTAARSTCVKAGNRQRVQSDHAQHDNNLLLSSTEHGSYDLDKPSHRQHLNSRMAFSVFWSPPSWYKASA